MTPPGSSTVEPHRAHWNYSVLRDAVEFQHLTMRTKCSDKCTAHRYQEIYARTLVHFRVIDDGSHFLKHTSFSFLFWLKAPGLAPGGYLIIEDLQVTAMADWGTTALDYDAAKHEAHQPAIARGTTVVNYAQSLLLCKLSALLCLAPQAGEEHAMIHYVNLVDQIIVAPEAVSFRKSKHFLTLSSLSPKLTSDMCIALDASSDSSFDRRAKVLAVRLEGHHSCQTKRCLHQQRNTCRRGWALADLTSLSCGWLHVPLSKRACPQSVPFLECWI
ncbi:Hypothetical protein, putative [Bodo saltans]|uniref:Uncharacterized protein n=1 Tax=Bodo saltans TaxID=75058 RepID=A0A0S4IQ20_BODSA|nr:Hypothetical protein, putative [Bodo saltans]|eukprot:CUF09850.1 Hypothetical protein, putative [Bodo saltans]